MGKKKARRPRAATSDGTAGRQAVGSSGGANASGHLTDRERKKITELIESRSNANYISEADTIEALDALDDLLSFKEANARREREGDADLPHADLPPHVVSSVFERVAFDGMHSQSAPQFRRGPSTSTADEAKAINSLILQKRDEKARTQAESQMTGTVTWGALQESAPERHVDKASEPAANTAKARGMAAAAARVAGGRFVAREEWERIDVELKRYKEVWELNKKLLSQLEQLNSGATPSHAAGSPKRPAREASRDSESPPQPSPSAASAFAVLGRAVSYSFKHSSTPEGRSQSVDSTSLSRLGRAAAVAINSSVKRRPPPPPPGERRIVLDS